MARPISAPIDPVKLENELKKRGLAHRFVSREVGHGDSYIASCLNFKRISLASVQILKLRFNIDPTAYVVKAPVAKEKPISPPTETTPDPASTTEPIDYDRLGTIIYNAVYSAVKKAWSE